MIHLLLFLQDSERGIEDVAPDAVKAVTEVPEDSRAFLLAVIALVIVGIWGIAAVFWLLRRSKK